MEIVCLSVMPSQNGSILPMPTFQFHAMDTLQKNEYDLARAMSTLVPQGGPVLCRDEMEEWSASEAMLFEEALEKYGKDFNDIRQDFVSPMEGWANEREDGREHGPMRGRKAESMGQ